MDRVGIARAAYPADDLGITQHAGYPRKRLEMIGARAFRSEQQEDQINRLAIGSAKDVQKAIETYAGRSAMRIVYERAGRVYYTDVMIQ